MPASGDPVAATRQALRDSVAHHFVSDVPVGIFLSGGVDSTALLALARETGQSEVRALTMAMPGSADDESALARRTAQHFGVRHDVCEVDGASATALFADYLAAMDQPSIDGMNTLAVSQLARSCGMKVMLSGIGADELFGGYPSIQAVPKFDAWNRRLVAAGPLRTIAGSLFERLPDPRWRRIGDLLGEEPELSTVLCGVPRDLHARRSTSLDAAVRGQRTRRDAGASASADGSDATGRRVPAGDDALPAEPVVARC